MKSKSVSFLVFALLTACTTDEPAVTPRDAGFNVIDLGAHGGKEGGDVAVDAGRDFPRNSDASSDLATADDVSHDAASPDAARDVGDGADQDSGGATETGDTCGDAIDATAGGSFTGDTTLANDDYSASLSGENCPSGAASGRDVVYALAPLADTTYDITVTPTQPSFDPFLYVRADCALDDCIDGTVLNGAGVKESLTVSVPGGATYFLIVDGELGSAGSYTLDVLLP